MLPKNIGIPVNQGADFIAIIQVSGDEGPIDITNYAFLGEMRATTETGSPLIAEFTFAIQNQTTNKGQVEMTLPAVTNEMIAASTATPLQQMRTVTPFVFDVKMQDSVGTITRILQGIIAVSPEATQESF